MTDKTLYSKFRELEQQEPQILTELFKGIYIYHRGDFSSCFYLSEIVKFYYSRLCYIYTTAGGKGTLEFSTFGRRMLTGDLRKLTEFTPQELDVLKMCYPGLENGISGLMIYEEEQNGS